MGLEMVQGGYLSNQQQGSMHSVANRSLANCGKYAISVLHAILIQLNYYCRLRRAFSVK